MNPLLTAFLAVLLGLVNTGSFGADSRGYDSAMLEQGKDVFRINCSECHGDNAQGTVANWKKRDTNGKLPPPPLNGTAHAWHHPIRGLAHTIKKGTLSIGGSMPAWEDKLSDDEIFSIIIWLSSLWPDEIYNAWLQRNNN